MCTMTHETYKLLMMLMWTPFFLFMGVLLYITLKGMVKELRNIITHKVT